MTIDLDHLDAVLRADADRPVPAPTVAFVDQLELRLLTLDATTSDAPVLPRGVGWTGLSGAAIGVATVAFVGAAAAAGVAVVRHVDQPDPHPVPTESTSSESSTVPVSLPVTVPVVVPVVGSPPQRDRPDPLATEAASTDLTSASTVAAASTTPSSAAPPAPPAIAPSTAPASTPASAAPATTEPSVPPSADVTPTSTDDLTPAATEATAASTTEVRVPPTIALVCQPESGGVTCAWAPGPAGTSHYLLLRSTPNEPGPGRVLTPAPGDLSFLDATAVPGTTYTYLVHAFSDSTTSLAHSGPATVVA